jgi:branched-chain amino acid transport system substrate-binding protein
VALKVFSELMVMPKVAIIAEQAVWGDLVVEKVKGLLPGAGLQLAGVWRPDQAATDVGTELSAIEASGANVIFTVLSGPVGVPYARKWGELEIPAASVGINVEAQADGFSEATGGYGDYETTMNIYARDVKITEETLPFIDRFIAEMGEVPTYNAGTYDALYILKEAIERAGTLDKDAIVVELEKTDRVGTPGRLVFDETHDVTWGPGYVTAIGVQWQNGQLKGIWPPSDGSWEGVVYEGIVDYMLPPWMVE